jgi:hypothetical protein
VLKNAYDKIDGFRKRFEEKTQSAGRITEVVETLKRQHTDGYHSLILFHFYCPSNSQLVGTRLNEQKKQLPLTN